MPATAATRSCASARAGRADRQWLGVAAKAGQGLHMKMVEQGTPRCLQFEAPGRQARQRAGGQAQFSRGGKTILDCQ